MPSPGGWLPGLDAESPDASVEPPSSPVPLAPFAFSPIQSTPGNRNHYRHQAPPRIGAQTPPAATIFTAVFGGSMRAALPSPGRRSAAVGSPPAAGAQTMPVSIPSAPGARSLLLTSVSAQASARGQSPLPATASGSLQAALASGHLKDVTAVSSTTIPQRLGLGRGPSSHRIGNPVSPRHLLAACRDESPFWALERTSSPLPARPAPTSPFQPGDASYLSASRSLEILADDAFQTERAKIGRDLIAQLPHTELGHPNTEELGQVVDPMVQKQLEVKHVTETLGSGLPTAQPDARLLNWTRPLSAQPTPSPSLVTRELRPTSPQRQARELRTTSPQRQPPLMSDPARELRTTSPQRQPRLSQISVVAPQKGRTEMIPAGPSQLGSCPVLTCRSSATTCITEDHISPRRVLSPSKEVESTHDVEHLANTLRAELAGVRAVILDAEQVSNSLRTELAQVQAETRDHMNLNAKLCAAVERRLEVRIADEVKSLRSELIKDGDTSTAKTDMCFTFSGHTLPEGQVPSAANIADHVFERMKSHDRFRQIDDQYSNLMDCLNEVLERLDSVPSIDTGLTSDLPTDFASLQQAVVNSVKMNHCLGLELRHQQQQRNQDHNILSSRMRNLERMVRVSGLSQVHGVDGADPNGLEESADLSRVPSPEAWLEPRDEDRGDLMPSPEGLEPLIEVTLKDVLEDTVSLLQEMSVTLGSPPQAHLLEVEAQSASKPSALEDVVARLQELTENLQESQASKNGSVVERSDNQVP